MNRKANQQQKLIFFFFLFIYLFLPKPESPERKHNFNPGRKPRCSVSFLFMQRRHSALSIFNSVLLGFRRECIESDSPPETFSEPSVRSCKRAALLDWRPDCLQLVRLLACIVTVANVQAGQKWNFYLLPCYYVYWLRYLRAISLPLVRLPGVSKTSKKSRRAQMGEIQKKEK